MRIRGVRQLAKKISATAYQALRDAIAVIYWYKPSLRRYLYTALREQPAILAGIDFGTLTKREAADEVVNRLAGNERLYQDVTVQLMLEISNMTSFPELERHEDRDKLVSQAEEAVSHLKAQTQAHEELVLERERSKAARKAYADQAVLERQFADDIARLKDQFLDLSRALGEDPQTRGVEFEKFLNELFAVFDLEPRLAYRPSHEQVDGAFTFDTDDYILEAKWTKQRTSRGQADEFASKVQRKGKNALGLLVSCNGLSEDAISVYNRSTPFMTMDGVDLFAILDQRVRLDDLLRRKKRHANETGECYFPSSRLFE